MKNKQTSIIDNGKFDILETTGYMKNTIIGAEGKLYNGITERVVA